MLHVDTASAACREVVYDTVSHDARIKPKPGVRFRRILGFAIPRWRTGRAHPRVGFVWSADLVLSRERTKVAATEPGWWIFGLTGRGSALI